MMLEGRKLIFCLIPHHVETIDIVIEIERSDRVPL